MKGGYRGVVLLGLGGRTDLSPLQRLSQLCTLQLDLQKLELCVVALPHLVPLATELKSLFEVSFALFFLLRTLELARLVCRRRWCQT